MSQELDPKFLLNAFLDSKGVSTDTRTLQKGQLFFALKGERFDGNKYVCDAIELGAKYAISDDSKYLEENVEGVIYVEDTLKALQDLSRAYRSLFDIPVFAITGSNGKTTCKELIAWVLSKKYTVHYTRGNFNNYIGVPLTLLAAERSRTEFMIIEMGANRVGDIRELCEIALPTAGTITNVGKAHLEGFGGIERVREGKRQLFDYIATHQGDFITNDLEPSLEYILGESTYTVSGILKRFHLDKYTVISMSPVHIVFERGDELRVESMHGTHQVKNIILTIAVGLHFGLDIALILSRLAEFKSISNRFEVREGQQGVLFVLDAYNANPNSMRASLDAFYELPYNRHRVVVLGEMLELGEYSLDEHKSLVQYCKRTMGVNDRLWLYGEQYTDVMNDEGSGAVRYFSTIEELKQNIANLSSVVVLLKGSRGNQLERLLEE